MHTACVAVFVHVKRGAQKSSSNGSFRVERALWQKDDVISDGTQDNRTVISMSEPNKSMEASRSLRKPKGKGNADWKRYIVPAILVLILANAAFYAFTHIEGPSAFGDDPNYLYLASAVVHGTFRMEPGYIFSVRLMSFMPIAAFYALFGTVSNLTSTLWNIVSYLGIIIVAFLSVKLLHSEKAGLISAFLVSIFPLVTQYAVNIGEDVPLTFITSLTVLMFLYAERSGKRWQYFASGALLVFSWLISYEAAVIILFLLVYGFIQVLRKRIRIDRKSLYFFYGIAIPFLVVFAYSYINAGMPFVTITANLRFYSAVGNSINGFPTIPSANTDLNFYPDIMFQYRLLNVFLQSPSVSRAFVTFWSLITTANNNSVGLFFYLLIPAAAVLLTFDRRASFLVFWFAFAWLFLELGPMSVNVSFNPLHITYLLSHRLDRFMLVTAVPLCGIIGVALSRLLAKNRYLLAVGACILIILLAILYINNYVISSFWYYWQQYPASVTMEVADFLKPYIYSSAIYVDALIPNGGFSFAGAYLPDFFGYPSDPHFYGVAANVSCSSFMNNSYVVWSGAAPDCVRFVRVLSNITVPSRIPSYIVQEESVDFALPPTDVYYVK